MANFYFVLESIIETLCPMDPWVKGCRSLGPQCNQHWPRGRFGRMANKANSRRREFGWQIGSVADLVSPPLVPFWIRPGKVGP